VAAAAAKDPDAMNPEKTLGNPGRRAFPGRLAAHLFLSALVFANLAACEQTVFNVPTYQKGYKPLQPISYSHKLHAGDLQMECKYCHFGSEKSRKAGIPPLNVCMNCHKTVRTESPQIKKLAEAYAAGKSIPWIKVHNLPDFVSFDHSRHVNRGVACQTCHGPIQEMAEVEQWAPLSMGWCVNCHRNYNVAPPPALKEAHIHASTDCTGCHQ
jgi:hypothetical protein